MCILPSISTATRSPSPRVSASHPAATASTGSIRTPPTASSTSRPPAKAIPGWPSTISSPSGTTASPASTFRRNLSSPAGSSTSTASPSPPPPPRPEQRFVSARTTLSPLNTAPPTTHPTVPIPTTSPPTCQHKQSGHPQKWPDSLQSFSVLPACYDKRPVACHASLPLSMTRPTMVHSALNDVGNQQFGY